MGDIRIKLPYLFTENNDTVKIYDAFDCFVTKISAPAYSNNEDLATAERIVLAVNVTALFTSDELKNMPKDFLYTIYGMHKPKKEMVKPETESELMAMIKEFYEGNK